MVYPSRRLRAFIAPVVVVAAAVLCACAIPATASAATPASLYPDLWTWRNPVPTPLGFKALSMTTRYDGWAVTRYGGIYATDDGGKHWWLRNSTATQHLDGVHFVDSSHGWVVGDAGFMRRTTNGGASWTRLTSGTAENLKDVHFATTTRGWIVGDGPTLKRTTDGGATWAAQTPHAIGGLRCVTFVDEQHGWAGDGSGGVVRTTDGGAHWTRSVAIATRAVDDVFFVNANRGWAVGATGTISRTTDGGATWTPQSAGTIENFESVTFTSTTNGWACSGGANVFHTTDRGAHWTPVATAGAGVAYLAVPDGVHGCGIGGGTATTANGGATWTRRDVDVTESELLDVSFASKLVGWAVGVDGTILATKDGGTTWTQQASGTTGVIRAVAAASSTKAWAVGYEAATLHGFVLSTSDGGATWTPQTLPYADYEELYSVDCLSSQLAWISGGLGGVCKTTDGGVHWTEIHDTGSVIQDVDMVSTTMGWAATQSNIAKTVDGGVTWSGQAKPATWPIPGTIYDVSMVDAQIGYACGPEGHVMATVDGGLHWTDGRVTDTATSMRGVCGISATRAWAVSEFGFLFRTDNGGQTWTRQNSRTNGTLNAIATREGRVWVVGESGMILARGYAPAPGLARVSPSTVHAGSTLTIYGWGFGSSRGTSTVKIANKYVATYVSWTDMRIKVKVPSVAAGSRAVKVTVGGTNSNAKYVTVE